MGEYDERIHRHADEGSDAPFLSGPQGEAPRSPIGGSSDGIGDVLHDEPREEASDQREVTMIVFRDGRVWEAAADVPATVEDKVEWLALCIAALDTSVDMAMADEL